MISGKSTWYLCVVYPGKVHNFRLEIWTLDIIVIVTINFRSSGWRQNYMTLSSCWRNGEDIPAGDISQWIHTLCIHCVSTRFDNIVLIFQLARGITLQRSFWRRRGADLRTRYRITWKCSVWHEVQIIQLEKRVRRRCVADHEKQIFRLERERITWKHVVRLAKSCRSSSWRNDYVAT